MPKKKNVETRTAPSTPLLEALAARQTLLQQRVKLEDELRCVIPCGRKHEIAFAATENGIVTGIMDIDDVEVLFSAVVDPKKFEPLLVFLRRWYPQLFAKETGEAP